MMDLRDLYEEVILDHNRNPRNYPLCPEGTNCSAHGHNPLCGDEVQVHLKVEDGVIVFPPEIVGETVIAEGVWTANELTMEQTKKVCAAEARKEGKEFDEGEVTTCMTLYQISGTGAVVVAADVQ